VELPFGDARFDLITAVCVYHHVAMPDRRLLTREVVRVLRPGGVFAMIEHNPFNPVTQFIVKRTPVDQNAQLLKPSQARSLLRGAELGDLKSQFFLYFPESVYARLRGVEKVLSSIPLGGQYAVFGARPS
jgi:ubiquinone/menaquinone biosynthesis C-methylase UbiE